MAFTSTLGTILASKFGDEVYELILSNWGNRGVGADVQSLVYPGRPSDEPLPSVTGIAISPRSEVDRVYVGYTPNPLLKAPVLNPYPAGGVNPQDVLVSVDRPWFGQLNGPLAIRADPEQWFGDTYLPAGAPVAPFGTVLAPTVFQAPTLRLLLFLRGLASQGMRRSPLAHSDFIEPTGPAGPVAEQLVRVFNVHGRRRVRIMLRGVLTGGGTVQVRVGGVVSGVSGLSGPSTPIITGLESELVAATVLADQAATTKYLDLPQVQYLTLYMSRAGVGSTGGAYVFIESID